MSFSGSSTDDHRKVVEIIEKALELAGPESKGVILSYIRDRYAMMDDACALVKYRGEFANYLREVLGDSAEIIVAKIERAFEEEEKLSRAVSAHVASAGSNMPVCYISNASLPPEKMRRHLEAEHTKEDLAHHLAVVYVDDWREEAELREENDAELRQLLRN